MSAQLEATVGASGFTGSVKKRVMMPNRALGGSVFKSLILDSMQMRMLKRMEETPYGGGGGGGSNLRHTA